MLLPWLTFMILYAALYVRMIRADVIETMSPCRRSPTTTVLGVIVFATLVVDVLYAWIDPRIRLS